MDVTSTLQGERVGMTIDQSALSHIMNVLTDLYEDPELAIIREYSTNALDANVEAGNRDPIETTTPSALSPFFRVKDAGVGLTVEDIREIYSRYGTSTKRESNDVVGMLGLGCKSALTYTDQFTLASVKDERKVTVAVSRDEDGAGSMTIVSDEATSEPNGTEVIIPVKRSNEIEDKAYDFFRFWQPGTVLVNGKAPRRIGGMWVNDKILITDEVNEDIIVMGNVPYPAPGLNMRDRLGFYSKVVAWVDIGAVSFTPSREGLQDTPQVREQVAKIKADVIAKMDASFKAQIEAAATPSEMIRLYMEARQHGYGKGGQRLGIIDPADEPAWTDEHGLQHRLPTDFGKSGTGGERLLVLPWQKIYRRKDGEWYPGLPIGHMVDALVLEGFDAAAFSPTKRQKFEAWKADADLDWTPARVVCIDKLALGERMWLRDEQVVQWADIDAIKIERPKDGNGRLRPKGTYSGKQPGNGWGADFQADSIDTTKPVYYEHGSWWNVRGHVAVRMNAVDVDNSTIVALSANRIAKFRRDFPQAKTLGEAWQAHLKTVWKPFHKDDFLALALDLWDKKLLTRLPLSRIDDPAVRRWIKLADRKVDTKLATTYNDFARYTTPPTPEESNPLDKYPLLDRDYRGSQQQVEHSIIYINAAYAAEKEAQS